MCHLPATMYKFYASLLFPPCNDAFTGSTKPTGRFRRPCASALPTHPSCARLATATWRLDAWTPRKTPCESPWRPTRAELAVVEREEVAWATRTRDGASLTCSRPGTLRVRCVPLAPCRTTKSMHCEKRWFRTQKAMCLKAFDAGICSTATEGVHALHRKTCVNLILLKAVAGFLRGTLA